MSASLKAWEELLDAVASRLPRQQQQHEAGGGEARPPPLSPALLDHYPLSPFGRGFLSRVRPPPTCRFVAPAISAFISDPFTALYGSEPSDSPRLRWVANTEPDEWPALLLPATSSVLQPALEATFDKPWGFAKFTVSRRAGLYLGADMTEADAACFVTHGGASPVFQFSPPQCPWGPRSLAQAFRGAEKMGWVGAGRDLGG
jgi:hypothetical protein